uniref:Uncharacterized protein n=1 Tax=Ditylenchus dipsaci TaxID=166011 RepID=A0A915DGJ4_9BILA
MLEKAAKELRLVNDEVIRLRQMHYKHATVKAMTPEEYKPTEASIKLLKENIRQLQQKDKQHQVDLEKLKNELKIKETNIEKQMMLCKN